MKIINSKDKKELIELKLINFKQVLQIQNKLGNKIINDFEKFLSTDCEFLNAYIKLSDVTNKITSVDVFDS